MERQPGVGSLCGWADVLREVAEALRAKGGLSSVGLKDYL